MPDDPPSRRERRIVALGRVVLWGARATWVVVAVVGGRAVGDAVADRSDAVQVVATAGAWVGWAAGALALAVPSVVTLTAVRAVVPGALVVAGVAAVAGAGAGDTLALGLPALLAAVLVASAETGRVYLQASAYGDEQRFGLRPPLGYLAATVVSWSIWVAAVVAAPLAWAARSWLLAAVATVVAAATSLTLPRRWHQLSRRWLVFVPAGLVLHDPVVLAEAVPLPRRNVLAVVANQDGPGAAAGAVDLTGPTPGLAVEVVLDTTARVVLAPRPSEPQGRPIELRALLVSPTRPGAVLATAARRHVGH